MAVLLLLWCGSLQAQQLEEATIEGNTILYNYTPIEEGKKSGLEEYLSSNLDDRKVRFNIFGGPGYSANTGWRLTAIGNLYYRQGGKQTTTPGTLSLSATASLTGYYSIEAIGRNYLGRGNHRLDYGLNFSSEPTYIWGLDYDTSRQGISGSYTSREYGAWLRYRYSFTPKFFLTLLGDYQNIAVLKPDLHTQLLIDGKGSRISIFGAGIGIGVDTRNSSINATRGIYAFIEFIAQPKFANNTESNLYQLNITFDYYQSLWRGATLALDLYGELHNAATPWLLRAELGGDNRMRGYFRGRYNGDAMLCAQLELRQHIWEGLSVAAWGGAGTAFSKDDVPAWNKVLPSYGAGIRWAINSLTSIRLDIAFGRDSRFFILGLNEAF